MAANNDIDRVRERTDIVEIIGRHVPLKKAGRTFKACCPFHQEKTPSFVVYPDSQSYYCFGCGQSGDAFSFTMKTENLDFPEALRRLAGQAGIELIDRQAGRAPIDPHRQRLYDALAAAAAFYHHVLVQAAPGAPGRTLIGQRGLNRESVERFGLGYAPDAWEVLRAHLRERDFDDDLLFEAGLVSRSDDTGRVFDRFRGRLMFPIRDREGRTVGFGARALGTAMPKYLNSSQTPIFDKGSLLYALDVAAPAIKRADQAVIVEGYVDAIMAYQTGYQNVVATMGTALSEAQVGLLKPLTRRLVLALDADSAGAMATLRGIDTIRQSLTDDERPFLDAHGAVGFQRRLSADIRILTMPAGDDPDSLLRRDAAAWPTLVNEAQPVVDYVLETHLHHADLASPAGKRAVLEALAPLLRELGDSVAVSHYVGILSRRLAIDDRVIYNEISRRDRRALQHARQEAREEATGARSTIPPEDYLVGLLLRYPGEAAGLADRLKAEEFADSRNRLVWERYAPLVGAAPLTAVDRLAESVEPAVASHASTLLARLHNQTELPPSRAREEIVSALKRLRRRRDDLAREHWQSVLREKEAGGDGPELDTILQHLRELTSVERNRQYAPPPSPYFKDTRDRGA